MEDAKLERHLEHLLGQINALQFVMRELIAMHPSPMQAQQRVCLAIEQARAEALASPATTDGQLAGLDAVHLLLCGPG